MDGILMDKWYNLREGTDKNKKMIWGSFILWKRY